MRKLTILAALLLLLAAPLTALAATAGEWTGYITDTHCGKNGATRDHTAACVDKCMKGGSKAQIMNDADQKIFNLDSFEKVKALVGKKVTIKGSLDAASNTITVESATATK
jgi:hypothetical protein